MEAEAYYMTRVLTRLSFTGPRSEFRNPGTGTLGVTGRYFYAGSN